jgi:hypothetical protein
MEDTLLKQFARHCCDMGIAVIRIFNPSLSFTLKSKIRFSDLSTISVLQFQLGIGLYCDNDIVTCEGRA